MFAPVSNNRVTEIQGRLISHTHFAPLIFSQLALTDDADVANSSEDFIKGLGSISVQMSRVVIEGEADVVATSAAELGPRQVHEGVKKATMSHMMTYGEPKLVQQTYTAGHSSLLDTSEPYFLRFDFRYLSRDLLQLRELVPDRALSETPGLEPIPEPIPLPSAADEHVASDPPSQDEDELRKLEAENEALRRQIRYQKLREENEQLRRELALGSSPNRGKRELESGGGGEGKRIKIEDNRKVGNSSGSQAQGSSE